MVRLVLALTSLALLVLGVTAFRVWSVAREDHRRPVDAIVVLGAAQYYGRPSQIFRARLLQALELYRDDVAPRVITVGGSRLGDVYTEAEAGMKFLRGQGLPADAVTPVGRGDDTLTSLRALAREVTDVHKVVLVTDPWHSLRARRIARDLGFDANTSPARSGPIVQSRTTEARYILRETVAYLHYRVFRRSVNRTVQVS